MKGDGRGIQVARMKTFRVSIRLIPEGDWKSPIASVFQWKPIRDVQDKITRIETGQEEVPPMHPELL